MKTLFFIAITIILFSSCQNESALINNFDNIQTTIRTPSNMTISITKVDRSLINVPTSKVSITYLNDNTFTIVANPGTASQQTFTALSAIITEPDTNLKLVKNPSNNQVVYTEKLTCTVTADVLNKLIVNIQPGNINTTALVLIGEEQDGL
ncbi:MAG: hypothetical protein RLZZ546_2947 [Bacteroidota bacterium]|jgi:hypothetical protein